MQSSRSALQTLHTLTRALPATPRSSIAFEQRRHASFSLSSLRNLLPRRKSDTTTTTEGVTEDKASTPVNTVKDQPKGLFDTVTDEEEVLLSRQDYLQTVDKKATYVGSPTPYQLLETLADRRLEVLQHKSSTANFKTSKRKLNDLARLVAGRTADEALLQLQVSSQSLVFDEIEKVRELISLGFCFRNLYRLHKRSKHLDYSQ